MGRTTVNLKARNYIYDLEEFTETQPQPLIEVILTDFVDGLGSRGDIVKVPPQQARYKLLLPKLAVYASPENLEKWEKYKTGDKKDEKPYSSHKAAMTVKYLRRRVIKVEMSMDQPWILEPWHVSVAFRRGGVYLPVEAVTLPNNTITGPNLENEKKVFLIGVTINKVDKVQVRCYLHHWSADPTRVIPEDKYDFRKVSEPLFPEDAELLKSFPPIPLSKEEKTVLRSKEGEDVTPLWTVLS
jgi:large subunit ribosomal protein L9